ncbi:MAG TPA: hypothetical protein VMT20_15010 [Terriglobia bacterium]|nr:hypothetical protein [Terriglobia bacterium]
MNSNLNAPDSNPSPHALSGAREDDALYQNGRVVGRALDARVDQEAREIHFGEISNSDELLLPEDCEYRNYRVLIQHVGFATREEHGAAHKGRVLKTVVAEILGFREQ